MLEDLAVFTIYMSFIFGLIAVAGFSEWLVEKVAFLNRLMDLWLEHMSPGLYVNEEGYDDNQEQRI